MLYSAGDNSGKNAVFETENKWIHFITICSSSNSGKFRSSFTLTLNWNKDIQILGLCQDCLHTELVIMIHHITPHSSSKFQSRFLDLEFLRWRRSPLLISRNTRNDPVFGYVVLHEVSSNDLKVKKYILVIHCWFPYWLWIEAENIYHTIFT